MALSESVEKDAQVSEEELSIMVKDHPILFVLSS